MDKLHIKINKDLFRELYVHATVASKLDSLDIAADRIRKIYLYLVRGSK